MRMDNNEKKEYGGCLGTLLPLWIFGQILTIIYNMVVAGLYTDFPLVPIVLIAANIIALVGIILLLKFKKIGFYIFILTFVISFFVGVFFPDYVVDNTVFKSLFGLGLFLLLMSFKNKETKLNGYQTLGLFRSKIKTEDCVSKDQTTIENIIENTNNEFIATDIINAEDSATSDDNNVEIISEEIKEERHDPVVDNNHTNPISMTIKITRKQLVILWIIVAIILCSGVGYALYSFGYSYGYKDGHSSGYKDGHVSGVAYIKNKYENPKGDGSAWYAEPINNGSDNLYHSTYTCPYIRNGINKDWGFANSNYRKQHSYFCSKCMDDNLIRMCEDFLYTDEGWN